MTTPTSFSQIANLSATGRGRAGLAVDRYEGLGSRVGRTLGSVFGRPCVDGLARRDNDDEHELDLTTDGGSGRVRERERGDGRGEVCLIASRDSSPSESERFACCVASRLVCAHCADQQRFNNCQTSDRQPSHHKQRRTNSSISNIPRQLLLY